MMTNTQYSDFRKKINPIIKACSVSKEQAEAVRSDLSIYKGASSFTRSKVFYFNDRIAMEYQEELLNICRDLPKSDIILPGTACTISSTSLVKGSANSAILQSQFEAAEKFLVILNLAELALYRPIVASTGIIYLVADITCEYKDKVM